MISDLPLCLGVRVFHTAEGQNSRPAARQPARFGEVNGILMGYHGILFLLYRCSIWPPQILWKSRHVKTISPRNIGQKTSFTNNTAVRAVKQRETCTAWSSRLWASCRVGGTWPWREKKKSLRPSFRFVSKWDTQNFHLKNMVVLSHGMEKNGFPILFWDQNFPFSVSQQLPTLQAYSNTSWLWTSQVRPVAWEAMQRHRARWWNWPWHVARPWNGSSRFNENMGRDIFMKDFFFVKKKLYLKKNPDMNSLVFMSDVWMANY